VAPFTIADYEAAFEIANDMGVTFVKKTFNGRVGYLPQSTVEILESNPLERIIEGDVDITCPFLGRDGEQTFCKIYDKRPEVCRLFGVNTVKRQYLQCPYQEGRAFGG
jgi:Fe-S-cluster containining protein